jgi:hypothetical protein
VDEAYQQRDEDYSILEHAMNELSDEFDEKRSRVESLSRFSDENPHPVMRIPKEGELYYANSASKRILKTFDMEVKKIAPAYWRSIVGITLSKKKNETIELEVGQQFFSFTFSPVVEQEYVNIYGYDITGRKRAEN